MENQYQPAICIVCGAPYLTPGDSLQLGCPDCTRRLPAALIKACSDPFDYVARLRSGEIIRFSSADVTGDYAHLYLEGVPADANEELLYSFDRGIDVRVADIVWCADAPEG
jgi:hypothetical protein